MEQGPKQGPEYSKEMATIAKIYTDNKVVTACQGVPACRYAVSDPPANFDRRYHNQDQATDQEELNPQDDDVIGPQASKDDPPPGLPTPAQSPEPQPNITTASTNREPRFEHVSEKEARPRQEIRGDTDNKLATSCQGIPACRYAVTTINTMTDAFPTDTDPLAYNTTSRYTSIKFMGAMIDTRASKRSTAGYGQFLAF
jgi:hypothetical protein